MMAIPASFFKRLLAYMVDTVPITFVLTVVAMQFFGFFQTFEKTLVENPSFYDVKVFQEEVQILAMISMLVWVLYSLVMDCSEQQGTYGKKLLRLKVVNHKGERISFEASFKRNITKPISDLPLKFGYLWMVFDAKKQTWHDKIANCHVIETDSVKPLEEAK
jgi:uncharacterized RDD family membrane protein YckC